VSVRRARARPATVAPGAEVVERAARRLQSVASPDPFETLGDIRLGSSLTKTLAPTFQALGVTLEDAELRDQFDEDAVSRVTVARGAAEPFYLVRLERFILSDLKKKNRNAIIGLKSLFGEGSRVFMFSEGEPYLRFAYEIMFEQEWAPEVIVRFIPWGFVEDLQNVAEVQRLAMIKHRLGEDVFARPNPSLDALTAIDRKFLVEYMRDQARLNHEYFANTVRAMALPAEFDAELAGRWQGDASADARLLLEWTFTKQWFPANTERADYTVAGALLEQLTRQTGGDPAQRVGRILIQHALIRDQQCIRALRDRLKLND
jgi:hypothetical protein